ncbi:MATE family efflux transporter [Clostridium sp. D2Q-11]|uniref:MATE family efflux transporter n=1 Tax=Anaeromonas frigoriresistens TaxID=2683708 RepID=A0A942Z870_9FIRM|nr:MATE family efflux transporter [Anaeromonas frigoriresistens]MBS4537635.1 MATE family efflux transporter [Anaeromonas frigoriresistens]
MDYSKKRDLILNGNMAKVILILSGPIMLNNLIQTIYNLTDTYFVSRLGDLEVNAVGFVWPIIFFMMSIGIGVSIAGTALISQYTGSDDKSDARKVAGQILSFSFIFSIGLGIIGFFITPFIVKTMGAEGEMFRLSVEFLRIILLGMPTMFVFFAFNSIKQGQGDTYTPMIFGALSVGLNIILDPIFIFVLNLGVAGAAIATVLARGIFALYAVYTLFIKKEGIQLHKSDLKLNKTLLQKIISIGLPSSIGQSTTALGFAVLNIFVKSFGASTLTAFIIGNRINSLILMPAMGIGHALSTIVGQNLGADDIKRARKAVKVSTILTTIFLLIGGLIVFILARRIIMIFTDSEEVITQATFYLRVISASLPLMGVFQIFNGTFQGSGHTIMAMSMMTSRLWLFRIPLIILFKNFTNLQERSVWYAMILSNAIVCIIGLILYLSRKWEHKIIKKAPKIR